MLFTIGYEAASPEDFIATLKSVGIQVVADIRDRPQSRRPGFSKNKLSEMLAVSGIKYVHLKELGDPPEGREAARAGNFASFRRVFAGVMATPQAQAAMHELEGIAKTEAVCLLCYERDPLQCHRKIVSDALEGRVGCRATHLGVQALERILNYA